MFRQRLTIRKASGLTREGLTTSLLRHDFKAVELAEASLSKDYHVSAHYQALTTQIVTVKYRMKFSFTKWLT